MGNQQVREWESPTPWRKLAEIAKRVATDKQLLHGKAGEYGLIHASASDYEEAFELPVKLMIAQAEMKVIIAHAQLAQPGFAEEAIRKQREIDKLEFQLAQRETPDGR